MEVTLSEWPTTAAPKGREESLCWISDKIALFPILVLAQKKLYLWTAELLLSLALSYL